MSPLHFTKSLNKLTITLVLLKQLLIRLKDPLVPVFLISWGFPISAATHFQLFICLSKSSFECVPAEMQISSLGLKDKRPLSFTLKQQPSQSCRTAVRQILGREPDNNLSIFYIYILNLYLTSHDHFQFFQTVRLLRLPDSVTQFVILQPFFFHDLGLPGSLPPPFPLTQRVPRATGLCSASREQLDNCFILTLQRPW